MKVIIDVSDTTSIFPLKSPRDAEIQHCIEEAQRINDKVELVWTIGTEHPSTYVFPDSTIEDIRQKIDGDIYAAAKANLKKKGN